VIWQLMPNCESEGRNELRRSKSDPKKEKKSTHRHRYSRRIDCALIRRHLDPPLQNPPPSVQPDRLGSLARSDPHARPTKASLTDARVFDRDGDDLAG